MKNKKGITLIALVVTIIVLLILAGVALSLVGGSEGILSKASDAVDETTKAELKEEAELILSEAKTEFYEGKYADETIKEATFEEYLKGKEIKGSNGILTIDESGNITYQSSKGGTVEGKINEEGKLTIGDATIGTVKYKVTYDANGGTGDLPEGGTNYKKGDIVTIDFTKIPTREDYSFLGWATTPDAEEAEYKQDGENPVTFEIEENNTVLYAVWDLQRLWLVKNGVELFDIKTDGYGYNAAQYGSISSINKVQSGDYLVFTVSGTACAQADMYYEVDLTPWNHVYMEDITAIKKSTNNNGIHTNLRIMKNPRTDICYTEQGPNVHWDSWHADISTREGVYLVGTGMYCANYYAFTGELKFKNLYLTK